MNATHFRLQVVDRRAYEVRMDQALGLFNLEVKKLKGGDTAPDESYRYWILKAEIHLLYVQSPGNSVARRLSEAKRTMKYARQAFKIAKSELRNRKRFDKNWMNDSLATADIYNSRSYFKAAHRWYRDLTEAGQ